MEITQERVRELFDYREDGALVWKVKKARHINIGDVAGHATERGYVEVRFDRRPCLAHRIVFLWHHGWLPVQVDHRDANKANNRIDNLRPATQPQNEWNKAAPASNTSGFKGVHWHAPSQTWHARISVERTRRHLGAFASPEDAHAAYVEAALKYHGEFARVA